MAKNDNENKNNRKTPEPGVFITKGMLITIPEFTIQELPDGSLKADPIQLLTEIEVTTYWLEIAFEHLVCAKEASKVLLDAVEAKNDKQIAKALEAEFLEGMQAITASAIAMDAYYSGIKTRINIPITLTETWKKNRTARYKQVTEILQRAFHLPNKTAQQLRQILRQHFALRDKAIHPQAGAQPPQLHPELNKVTDWRYVYYRFYNAKIIVGLSISVVSKTSNRSDQIKDQNIRNYCEKIKENVKPIVSQWEEQFDKLL